MFELKEAIISWKTGLYESGNYREEDIDELESHLSEDISNLVENNKLSDEDAFTLAVHRIGGKKELDMEFRKVNKAFVWKKRFLLILGAYLFTHFIYIFNIYFTMVFRIGSYLNIVSTLYITGSIFLISIMILIISSAKIKIRFLEMLDKIIKSRFIIYAGFVLMLLLSGFCLIGTIIFFFETRLNDLDTSSIYSFFHYIWIGVLSAVYCKIYYSVHLTRQKKQARVLA